jgi:hypothetical protein
MSLVTVLTNFAQRVGTEAKAVRLLLNGNAADLSALTTTAKSNLVAAINEVKAAAGGAAINDATTSSATVWSSQKTSTEIGVAVAGVIASAPGALDTLDELAAALGDDANFAATVTTGLSNRVRVDAAQSLTAPQRAQGLANLGALAAADVGNTETNFVTLFEAALV